MAQYQQISQSNGTQASNTALTPSSWASFNQRRDDIFTDMGALGFLRTITLDSAVHMATGTLERTVHFPFTTRRVVVRNLTSASLAGNSDPEVRVSLGHVHNLYNDPLDGPPRPGSGLFESGSVNVISQSFYMPLRRYGEEVELRLPLRRITVSAGSPTYLNVSCSVCVMAELTPIGTGSAPVQGGLGVYTAFTGSL